MSEKVVAEEVKAEVVFVKESEKHESLNSNQIVDFNKPEVV